MKKAPEDGANAGGVKSIVPLVNHLVHGHVLTNGDGRYAALLCRRTGRLQRLPRGGRA